MIFLAALFPDHSPLTPNSLLQHRKQKHVDLLNASVVNPSEYWPDDLYSTASSGSSALDTIIVWQKSLSCPSRSVALPTYNRYSRHVISTSPRLLLCENRFSHAPHSARKLFPPEVLVHQLFGTAHIYNAWWANCVRRGNNCFINFVQKSRFKWQY